MENPYISYYSQVILFSLFPFFFAAIKTHFRTTLFYIYLGLVLGFGGFMGQIWSVQLADGIKISGGNIAYATFIMTSVLFVAIERDIVVGRNIMFLVIVVNLFKFFLFSSMSALLSNPLLINPHAISSKVFSSSAMLMTVGGLLIISEIFLFIIAFELIKKKIKLPNLNIAFFTICFVLLLMLDGILFPLINYRLFPHLGKVIIGGMKNKLVLGASFAPMMILFLIVYKNRFYQYTKKPMELEGLIERTKEDLALTVHAQVKEIEKSERRRSNLISNLPGMAYRCLYDDFWTMQYLSDGSEALTGYNPSELIENNAFAYNDLIFEEDRQYVRNEVQFAIEENRPYTLEYRIRNKRGETKWVWEKGQAVNEKSGKSLILEGFILDISKRKRAEIKLQQNESMLAEAQALAHVGSWAWDIESGEVVWSEEVFKIFGLTPGHFSPNIDSVMSRFHPDDQSKHKKLIESALETREAYSFEARVLLPDQSVRQVVSTSRGIYDKEEKLQKIIGSVHDITDLKRAEKALYQSELQSRSFLNSLVDPLYTCSPDFRIQYMNPAMVERLGRDATGEVCHKAIHGSDNRCETCIFSEATQGKTIERNLEGSFDNRTYRTKDMPVYNEDGTVSKMTLMRDITDYLNVVEENEKARSRLAQAQKMESIGTLAGGIAHDFNNILSAIIGFTELALYDVQADSIIENRLKEVLAASNRAKELVAQILAFARQSEEEIKPIYVHRIVKEVLRFIRSSIPTTIDIEQDINSVSPILGNPTQAHQIMMNLCTNAAQSMEHDGGILKVDLKDISVDQIKNSKTLELKHKGYVRIRVQDSGVGIDPRIIDSIFEPYVTTKEQGEGTGMGLAVVRGIIESYGGAITVDSDLNKGSTFAVYLPIYTESIFPEPAELYNIPGGTERVLLVDDEESILTSSGAILKQLGYSVTTRTSGVEALNLFRSKPNHFDLIICDMTMPKMTGDKLSAEIIKVRPDIPVILCTGYSKNLNSETISKAGIKAMVQKPILKAKLARIIRKVLD